MFPEGDGNATIMLSTRDQRGGDRSGLRAYNERMILNLIRQQGSPSRAEIARATGLSAQTASNIVNLLLKEGLLKKGEKVRGQVGQPSTPISLNPQGAYSIGIKIGRRSLEVAIVDFLGNMLRHSAVSYDYPKQGQVLREIERRLDYILGSVGEEARRRIVGVGVAMPKSLEAWTEELGAPPGELEAWASFDVRAALSELTGFEVELYNDATAACAAEIYFGRAITVPNAVYFYIGAFIGGGVVLDGRLFPGSQGNAGALGSMPVGARGPAGAPKQLIQEASLLFLERDLAAEGLDPQQQIEEGFPGPAARGVYNAWRDRAARAIAQAVVAATSVIDFQGVVIDGLLPPAERSDLAEAVDRALADYDRKGLSPAPVQSGSVGHQARVLGSAILPLYKHFSPDQNLLVKPQAPSALAVAMGAASNA